jgi:hypothetical protein
MWTILGSIEAGGVAYIAYQHIKKYGLKWKKRGLLLNNRLDNVIKNFSLVGSWEECLRTIYPPSSWHESETGCVFILFSPSFLLGRITYRPYTFGIFSIVSIIPWMIASRRGGQPGISCSVTLCHDQHD